MIQRIITIALLCFCSFQVSLQVCGYNASGIFGSIQSPNYPSQYGDYLSCYYSLTTLSNTYMVLDIVDMDFYDTSDYLYIYDGPTKTDPVIGKFTSKDTGMIVNASTNEVLVYFYTDYDHAGRGFNITFHSNVCSSNLMASSGVLKSPLYPEPYIASLDCYNTLTTPENTAMTLFIESLDLESCCDFLKIYDGNTTDGRVLGVYTGQLTNISISTTSNQALLCLHSDQSNELGGYSLYFEESEQCGETVSAPYGSIVSQGYPIEPYENSQDCYYRITTSPNTGITFDVVDMQLEETFDLVEIYEGHTTSGPMIGRFTGVQQGVYANVSINEALVHFHTDGSGQGSGFYIYFEEMETHICPASNYLAESGILKSPLYPSEYPDSVDCYYSIETNEYSQISLHVNDLNVQLSIGCDSDFVEIFDGPTSSNQLLAKYCGNGPVNDIVSSSNEVFVHFHSDRNYAGSGFSISYNTNPCVDPMEYYGDSGTIYSPGYPNSNYPTSADCRYAIVTPEGSTVQLTVAFMNLEYADLCQFDFVRIYDGPDEDHPLIDVLCGNYTLKDIQTSTNKILIKFHSDVSNTYEGFSMIYTASYLEDESKK